MLSLVSEFDPGHFRPAYRAARQQFVDTYRQLPASLQQGLVEHRHPLTGPDGEVLACDVAWLGQRRNPKSLLVLIAGTHGVEGFAGSAIEADCLPLLAPLLAANEALGVLVVHALNPWGFAWLRRYDHEGIDLNRNFVDFNQPLPDNDDYDALHTQLLDPPKQLASLWQEPGLDPFTEIVTRGQYRHADGCFFGGTAPSWSRQIIEAIGDMDPVKHAERIAVLDLHTGLGPYGYGELINDHPPGTVGDVLARQWYGSNACSAQLGESVSTMKHGLLDFFWHELIGERGCFVTLEFGTYEVQQLLAVLLREQAYQASIIAANRRRDLLAAPVVALKDFFYPAELSWQQQVLFRGRQVVSMALRGLMNG